MFFVKVRFPGQTRWSFVSSKGRVNPLRIHALQFATRDAAESFITENTPGNPGVQWCVRGAK